MKQIQIKLLIILTGISILFSCSNLPRKDDAVRIMEDSINMAYRQNPYTNALRDASTLRGTVLGLKVVVEPDSCPITVNTQLKSSTFVLFIDSLSEDDEFIEAIPIEDVIAVGSSIEPVNEFENINIFENFNNPQGIKQLREVPVDTVYKNCNPCNCRPIHAPELNLPGIDLSIDCPKREFSRWYFELKGGYNIYTDMILTDQEGKDGYSGELSSGFRFGDEKNSEKPEWNPQWAAGLTYSTGVNIWNAYEGENFTRPALLIFGKYQSARDRFFGLCMRPFVYAHLGFSIDEFTVDLMKMNFCDGCEIDPEVEEMPDVDVDIPISWGIGVGMDIPIIYFLDVSVDLGYRSMDYGEAMDVLNYINLPVNKTVDMFILRFGFTF